MGDEATSLPVTIASTLNCGDFTVELSPDMSSVVSVVNDSSVTILLKSENPDDISTYGLDDAQITVRVSLTDYSTVF